MKKKIVLDVAAAAIGTVLGMAVYDKIVKKCTENEGTADVDFKEVELEDDDRLFEDDEKDIGFGEAKPFNMGGDFGTGFGMTGAFTNAKRRKGMF